MVPKRKKILALFGMLLIFSCKHEPLIGPAEENPFTPLPPVFSQNPCDPDTVYFQVDILPILRSNCAFSGCHGDGSSEDGVELSSYANVMGTSDIRPGDPNGSGLYEMITENDPDDRMPQDPYNPLTSEQIAKIKTWILQGALNNSCDKCDTSNVTFSLNVKPIIQNNCQGCHSGGNPKGGILLSNYTEIKSRVQSGQLLGAINHQAGFTSMPYNQSKLNQCLIDQIQIWANADTPNN